jgi:electron transport complex protein RnfE
LAILGGLRELIGTGSIFKGAEQLLGPAARNLGYSFTADGNGFLLALLPPGAFLALALLIALRNRLQQQRATARQTASLEQPTKILNT